MELPVVNHEDYFAKIGDDHKFPINKFGELAKYSAKNCQCSAVSTPILKVNVFFYIYKTI